MSYVILGMLLTWPSSLYDLVKQFEGGVSMFYSASTGSIKRALDGLLRRGHIEVASEQAGGRGKKVYQVTREGEAEFRSWLTTVPDTGDPEVALLSRLFFFGLLDAEERRDVAEQLSKRGTRHRDELRALRSRIDSQEVPEEFAEIARYRIATLEYGIAVTSAAADWFEQFRSELATR